jgi:hypothetical protein
MVSDSTVQTVLPIEGTREIRTWQPETELLQS